MLASAAMLLSAGDEEALQWLDFQHARTLHHIAVNPKPVEKFLQKERISDYDGFRTGYLFDEPFRAINDVLSGFALAGIGMLPLGSGFPLPGFDRIQFFGVGERAERDFIEKRFHNRSAWEQQLPRSILSGDALSDPDLFSLGVVLPSAVGQDPGFHFSAHCGIKTGRGIASLCAFLRLAGTKNGKAHILRL